MTQTFEQITIADVARFPRPGTSIPMRLGFSPNGEDVTYLASSEGNLVLSLFAHNVQTGETRVLAGPPAASANELRRERARLREIGVTSYQFAVESTVPTLLIPVGGSLRVSIDGGVLREMPGTKGALDARLSRDGKQVAFVREGELFVADVASGEPRQLTFGAEDGLTHGVAEFIAAEELDRSEGFWWSPDATSIAFVRADSRHIEKYPIVHQGKAEVDTEYHRYPFAGDPNAYVELGVVDISSGDITWMDLGLERDIYLARVNWRPDGALVAQVLDRAQTTIQLLEFDNSGRAKPLLTESTRPWVNLHNDLRFLDTGEFVWTSERTGFRHVYFVAPDGSNQRQLTEGDWVVTRVVALDEPRRLVYFEGTHDSVLERHLYRVSLNGGDIERMTDGEGWHSTVVSRDGERFLDVHSSATHAPTLTLRGCHDDNSTELFANEGNSAKELGLQVAEPVTFKASTGEVLHGALLLPPKCGSEPPPLIVSVYGGPHAQRVANEWSLTVDLRAQYLAREGFAVLRVDNRGSANRGLAFEGHLHLKMGTVEVADQAAAVRELAEKGIIDGNKVGIFGWSYGGYMTIMAMLLEPGLFKVGVAGAPVTDWDGYDTGYTERYMSTPALNPVGYEQGSALTHAGKLEGKLLLVHGGVDENVHFRHTARFITSLIQEGKDYDLLIFPGERHMPRDAKGLEYQERHLVEYFKKHL
jgi:dipeptidyl-peptidase 4